MLDRKCNSKRPLVFSHVAMIRTLSAHKAREIRERINCRLYLWYRGIHVGLVGDMLAEGRAIGGRIKRRVE